MLGRELGKWYRWGLRGGSFLGALKGHRVGIEHFSCGCRTRARFYGFGMLSGTIPDRALSTAAFDAVEIKLEDKREKIHLTYFARQHHGDLSRYGAEVRL